MKNNLNPETDPSSKRIPRLVHQASDPLMSIMGYADLAMLQLNDQDPIRPYIHRIIEAAKKINEINKEILKSGHSPAENFGQIQTIGGHAQASPGV